MAGTVTASIVKNDTTSPPTFQNSAGTEIGTLCRAWVNFNGTGAVAIRSSFNVSSITDSGVGYYAVNFTTAMPDTNYSVSGTGSAGAASLVCVSPADASVARTTTAVQIAVATSNGAAYDSAVVNVAIFR